MNPYIPAGSEPGLTKEQIIEEEKKKLKEARQKIYEENQRYLDRHPEFRALLDDYVTSILNHKPADLVTFSTRYFQSLSRDHKQGPLPLIIAGPSGVGKGTLINRLLEQFPKAFGFSVSHTTRGPRPGEENGVHYFFVTQKDFEDAVLRGEFIEHAKVHTNYYGTSFQSVEKIKAQNKICILDIDVQGVQNVKASHLPCKTIFISPPSITELEHRLRGRGTETAEKIKVRLENATNESFSDQIGNYRDIHRFPEAEQLPGYAILRMDASLYFANCATFKTFVLEAASGKYHSSHDSIHTVVLDASAWVDIDLSGMQALFELRDELHKKKVRFLIACAKGIIRDRLIKSHFVEDLNKYSFFMNIDDAIIGRRPRLSLSSLSYLQGLTKSISADKASDSGSGDEVVEMNSGPRVPFSIAPNHDSSVINPLTQRVSSSKSKDEKLSLKTTFMKNENQIYSSVSAFDEESPFHGRIQDSKSSGIDDDEPPTF